MANSILELIGIKLQEARKKSGLTQAQVAKLIGINPDFRTFSLLKDKIPIE